MATYLFEGLKKIKKEPKLNCSVWELINYYLEEGEKEGVRGDIAFCQSIKETVCFTFGGDVLPEQNNYAGIGATGGVRGNSFDTPQIGVRAQIQHLKLYGSTEPLNGKCVDPRWFEWLRGTVTYWVEFGNGNWAADTSGYGHDIMAKYASLMATTPDAALVAKAKKSP